MEWRLLVLWIFRIPSFVHWCAGYIANDIHLLDCLILYGEFDGIFRPLIMCYALVWGLCSNLRTYSDLLIESQKNASQGLPPGKLSRPSFDFRSLMLNLQEHPN